MVLQPFFKVIELHRFSFLCYPGVVSVGLGIKIKNSRFTGIPSLVFGVEKKVALEELPSGQLIPGYIDRLPTDVVQIGKIKMLGYSLPHPKAPPEDQTDFRKTRMRPAQPGVSIGHYKVTAGTLGAIVKGEFPGGIAILSNNHILANGTSGADGLSRKGDRILQPAPYDAGGRRDTIARLYDFSPIIPVEKAGRGPVNVIDSALAIPLDPGYVTDSIVGLGRVSGTADARPGMRVYKSGRSTGVTSGQIVSIGNTIKVANEEKNYVFEEQIGIAAKSGGGDSGSLFVNGQGRAVGLLFAGGDNITYANPIGRVLDFYKVTM